MRAGKRLLDRISSALSAMPKQQRRLGAFLLENYRQAASMSLPELSEASGVSAPTVVRFSYALGCAGWPGLQKELQDNLPAKLTAVERLRMMEGLDTEDVIAASFRTDIDNLRATAGQNSPVLIDAVVNAANSARRLYLVGSRSSHPLVQFLEYYLRYVMDNVRVIRFDGADLYAQLLGIGPRDCVLAISFPRYSSRTIEVLENVRTSGATVVAITDHHLSPPALLSDYTLTAKSYMNSFVDSFVAPLALINVLIVKLGLLRRRELQDNFERLESLWMHNDIYASRDASWDENI